MEVAVGKVKLKVKVKLIFFYYGDRMVSSSISPLELVVSISFYRDRKREDCRHVTSRCEHRYAPPTVLAPCPEHRSMGASVRLSDASGAFSKSKGPCT